MLFQSIFQVFFMLPFLAMADEVIIRPPSGEVFSIEVNPEDRFSDVMALIGSYVNVVEEESGSASQQFPSKTYVLDFAQNNLASMDYQAAAASPAVGKRDYFRQPTAAEKAEIAFIIKTLSKGSLLTLIGQRAALEAAGNRIEGIHPLRLINYILSDAELKEGIRVMRSKHMVWSEFSDNISKNLDKEARNKNLGKDVIQDFATKVKIDSSAIIPPWNQFLDTVIKQ